MARLKDGMGHTKQAKSYSKESFSNMQLNEDFIQANKLILLGKLTANLVHEIRNPLSAIKLNLDYMNKDSSPINMRVKMASFA